MTDAPQIDDGRRFKELRYELLTARLAIPCVVGYVIVNEYTIHLIGAGGFVGGGALAAAALAAPSAVAKRGWYVFPIVAGAAFAAFLCAYFGAKLLGVSYDGSSQEAALLFFLKLICVPMVAAVGLAEGQLERSLATTFSGMLGGALSGGAVAAMIYGMIELGFRSVDGPSLLTVMVVVIIIFTLPALSCAVAHVGIGLSLALGRYLRDLPKRKAAVDSDATEG